MALVKGLHEMCDDRPVDDAIARYRTATEANDIEGIMDTLAHDAELVSPISGRMVFRGRDDVRILLTAVYGSLSDLRWDEEIGDRSTRVVIGAAKVGPVKLGDAMVFELDEGGSIKRIRPHLRPWLGLTAFAVIVGPRVARHPGAVWRALRGPRSALRTARALPPAGSTRLQHLQRQRQGHLRALAQRAGKHKLLRCVSPPATWTESIDGQRDRRRQVAGITRSTSSDAHDRTPQARAR